MDKHSDSSVGNGLPHGAEPWISQISASDIASQFDADHARSDNPVELRDSRVRVLQWKGAHPHETQRMSVHRGGNGLVGDPSITPTCAHIQLVPHLERGDVDRHGVDSEVIEVGDDRIDFRWLEEARHPIVGPSKHYSTLVVETSLVPPSLRGARST